MRGGRTCERVLLVDDDTDSLVSLRDLLELYGITDVRGARSIAEVEQVLKIGFAPSAIVLDLLLEGERGEALIDRLAGDAAYSSIPIIAISGDHLALRRLGGSVRRTLLKPVMPEQLLEALMEVCNP